MATTLFATGVMAYGKPQEIAAYATQFEVARNLDGSLVVFMVEPDKEITYVQQTAPNARTWGEKKSLGIYGNRIVTGSHADGRIALFNIGTLGNVLYSISQTQPNSSEWTKEQELPSAYGTQIETANDADGSLLLFFLEPDKELAYVRESGANSGVFGKPVTTGVYGNQIAVKTGSDGRITVALIGTMANVMSQVTQVEVNSNQWSEEAYFDGAYGTQIEFARQEDGSLMLLFLEPDREVAVVEQQSPGSMDWSKASSIDVFANAIVAGADKAGIIQVFDIGTLGNALYRFSQSAANSSEWGPESDLSGYGKQIEVGINEDGRLDFFYLGMSGEVFVNYGD